MTRSRLCQLVATSVLGALTLTPTTFAQQAPTFSAGTAAVMIDVLVTRDGTPVTGLTASDFELRDGGVVQPHKLVGVETIPVALLLALDTSASVRGPALEQLKTAANGAVSSLRPGDQAAVMTFSQNIGLPSGWTDDRRRLRAAIDATTAQGSTSLTDAAFAALCQRPVQVARTLALVFTDGEDSSSWLSPQTVVDAARRSDAVVYGVTLSPAGGTVAEASPAGPGTLLSRLAAETGGESFSRADIKDLRAVFLDVLARFNQRYVLTYEPPNVQGSGWHPVEVRVKDPGLTVIARRGYSR